MDHNPLKEAETKIMQLFQLGESLCSSLETMHEILRMENVVSTIGSQAIANWRASVKLEKKADTGELREISDYIVANLPDGFGFILLAATFGQEGRLCYSANIQRGDAINMLKEWLIKCSAEEDWMKNLE